MDADCGRRGRSDRSVPGATASATTSPQGAGAGYECRDHGYFDLIGSGAEQSGCVCNNGPW
jgi:hypothetical protein